MSLLVLREMARLACEYYKLWKKLSVANPIKGNCIKGRISIRFDKPKRVAVYDNRYNKVFHIYAKSIRINADGTISLYGSSKWFARSIFDNVEIMYFLAFNDDIANYVNEKIKVIEDRIRKKQSILNTILNELGGMIALTSI